MTRMLIKGWPRWRRIERVEHEVDVGYPRIGSHHRRERPKVDAQQAYCFWREAKIFDICVAEVRYEVDAARDYLDPHVVGCHSERTSDVLHANRV